MSSILLHLRAEPSTAVCGQPGPKVSGLSFRSPDSLRKNLCSPVTNSNLKLFSNTPPDGTLGRLGASDQSTVAHPESGCSLSRSRPSRWASQGLTSSPEPATVSRLGGRSWIAVPIELKGWRSIPWLHTTRVVKIARSYIHLGALVVENVIKWDG